MYYMTDFMPDYISKLIVKLILVEVIKQPFKYVNTATGKSKIELTVRNAQNTREPKRRSIPGF